MSRHDSRRGHRTVDQLCRAHGHTGSPEELILRLCGELHGAFDGEVPTSLEVLASARSIRAIELTDMEAAGSIHFDGGHFVVRLRRSDLPPRRRFTLAHEIVHTFFRTNGRGRVDQEVMRFARDGEEHLCDVGAAELLMPAALFAAECPEVPTIDDVMELAGRFDTSIEAAGIRVTTLHRTCTMVVLEPAYTKAQERILAHEATQGILIGGTSSPVPRLRARYAHGADFVPRNKSVLDGCPLESCEPDELVSFTGETGLCDGAFRVTGRLLPRRHGSDVVPRVVALLHRL